jgi:hypothetical protein
MVPVLLGIAGAPPTVFYLQKSVKTTPYDIAVLQVDALISSQASGSVPAQAPATLPPRCAADPTCDACPCSRGGSGDYTYTKASPRTRAARERP